MALLIATALQYVNPLTFFAKDYRNWAVSDFALNRDWIDPPVTSLDELQKTWALYLKWAALCDTNLTTWSSSNGKAFAESPDTRKFRYTLGKDKDTAPTLEPASKAALPGTQREVTLAGVGQCEYFATQAVQALRAGGAPGKVPRADKVATPGHNWMLVNYSSALGSSPFWIAVD
jgi:hypothetical protein